MSALRKQCSRCSGQAEYFPCPPGQLPELTMSELGRQAHWCEQCQTILCGRCVGVPSSGEGLMMFVCKCPTCRNKVMSASEAQMR